jgi:hypothetical protein
MNSSGITVTLLWSLLLETMVELEQIQRYIAVTDGLGCDAL